MRDDLGDDRADDPRDVVLDLDHAVLPPEHRVQLRREAHEPGQRRHLLELLHLRGERRAVRRAAGALDRGDDAVDRGRPGDEAAGARLDLLRELVHRRVRVVPERGRERDEPVVRDLRVLRQPVRAVTGPRVEDRRVVSERPQPRT